MGADPEVLALWRWHAVKEIEHRSVAFDTFLHTTRRWSAFRRWRVRCILAVVVTRTFVAHRWRDTLDLLERDGISGWRARRMLLIYLLGQPGMLRRILSDWLSFFRPGFHPSRHDDAALLAQT